MRYPHIIGWTVAGHLRVDDMDDNETEVLVHFFIQGLTRAQKLELLAEIVQIALNSPELTQENYNVN